MSPSRRPSSAFTRAAAALIRPSQRATAGGIGVPETGKLATAFIGLVTPELLLLGRLRHRRESRCSIVRAMEHLTVADAQALWAPAGTYVNTASYGLPPRPASEALQAALEDWRGGRTSWEHWGVPGEEARASFARLVNVPVETVAIAANVSTFFGLIAASIPDGASVLAPDVEFTSLLFPFLVQADRGVTVRLVPRCRARRRDRAGHRRRRVQRGADGDRRGGRARRDRGGSARSTAR